MSKASTALLLYPNQLYPVSELPADIDEVVLVEEPLFFGTDDQYKLLVHKQKLVVYRAAMRRYIEEELWPAGFKVDYIEFHQLQTSADIVEKLKQFDHVHIFEFSDDVLSRRLVDAIKSHPEAPEMSVLSSSNFFISHQESDQYFSKPGSGDFLKFYQWQRERFNILINPETYKPLEGKWGVVPKNRQRVPKDAPLPSFQVFGSNDFMTEAAEYVQKYFPENPGSIQDIPWPTNRQEANTWLQEFIAGRLKGYDLYAEAIDGQAPWLHHSAIGPMLNMGLLQASDVIAAVTNEHVVSEVPIEDIESFVRNILGHREYARGVYRKKHVEIRTANSFQNNRRMTSDWYLGTTGLPPVDDVIRKVQARAYTHQVERSMILGNIMFLCEFHPDEVYRWFCEMFLDTYDWNAVPEVYGLSQGAAFDARGMGPLISSSNYILNMSHYEKGEWCNIWDGLYWRAVEKHAEKFAKHPTLKIAVKQHARIDANRRRIMGYRAEDFLKTKTSQGQH